MHGVRYENSRRNQIHGVKGEEGIVRSKGFATSAFSRIHYLLFSFHIEEFSRYKMIPTIHVKYEIPHKIVGFLLFKSIILRLVIYPSKKG